MIIFQNTNLPIFDIISDTYNFYELLYTVYLMMKSLCYQKYVYRLLLNVAKTKTT